jgi:hypothetical protein
MWVHYFAGDDLMRVVWCGVVMENYDSNISQLVTR